MDLKEAEAEEAETEDADVRGRIAVLEKRQINTPTSLRFWRTKSLNSPQTVDALSVKFHHCDLLRQEFRHFQKKFLFLTHKLYKS
jgi:hypothetical protein